MGNLDFFKTKMFCTNSSNNDVTITLMLLSQRKDYIPLHVLQKWSLLVEGTAQPCCGSARQKLFYMIHLHLFISLLFSWVVFSSTYCSHYHYAFLNFKVYSALPPATRQCWICPSYILPPWAISNTPWLILQWQVKPYLKNGTIQSS